MYWNVTANAPSIYSFSLDETKFAKSRVAATRGPFVERPTCRDTFPKAMIDREYTFPEGTKRSIKNLMPILQKEQCGHTDDGGVQPWMHMLLAVDDKG